MCLWNIPEADRAVSLLPRLLLELLELLFDKFNAVAAAHSVVLGHLQQTVASPCSQHDGDIKLYDMVDVWVKIQDVLQVRIPQVGTFSALEQPLEPCQRIPVVLSAAGICLWFVGFFW